MDHLEDVFAKGHQDEGALASSADILKDGAPLLIIGNIMPSEVSDDLPVRRCLWILPLGIDQQLVV